MNIVIAAAGLCDVQEPRRRRSGRRSSFKEAGPSKMLESCSWFAAAGWLWSGLSRKVRRIDAPQWVLNSLGVRVGATAGETSNRPGGDAGYRANPISTFPAHVSRYKYPPVWVGTEELFGAMSTTNSDNENKTRGFALISAGR